MTPAVGQVVEPAVVLSTAGARQVGLAARVCGDGNGARTPSRLYGIQGFSSFHGYFAEEFNAIFVSSP